ncbi:MAG: DUF805 domain-containing protein [Bradyrhizobium sp.]|uniref:DUF805 domain-containing protein n=1 Tax=Bradyrhizobium sp. TaxID=376 RepID=UPI0025C381B2|nr:DUF805 domain-containing protein [Bradyrhizobium sp.]MBI5261662.1 DUF805 domain-containing protein [Bradyrhizobium sp.]
MLAIHSWFFLSFDGRISRHEFRLGYFGIVLATAFLSRTLLIASTPPVQFYVNRSDIDRAQGLPVLLATLVALWPLAAVFAKRLHDLNLSGWWLLAFFAISPLSHAINIRAWIVILIVVAAMCIIPGARGNNRFGGDPLAHSVHDA